MHTAWFQGMHTVGYYLFIGLINPDIFSYGSFSHTIPGNVLAEDTISYPRKRCVPHKHSTPAPEAPMCFPGENRLLLFSRFFFAARRTLQCAGWCKLGSPFAKHRVPHIHDTVFPLPKLVHASRKKIGLSFVWYLFLTRDPLVVC